MIGTEIGDLISLVLLLLFIAVVAGIFFKRIKTPYTIGLFLIGVIITIFLNKMAGSGHPFDFVLSPEVILFLFLPPLVFEAAFHINKRLMMKMFVPIIILAIPGLIISTLIIGYIIGYVTPVPLIYAMLFGALISATDPVSVIGLFRNMGAPQKLTTILEGESLFNDACAIVTFSFVLGIISADTFEISAIVYGAEGILWSFSGGILTGIVAGALIGSLIGFSRSNTILSSIISMLVAYTSYLLADMFFHASGIIAVLTAGLIVGWISSIWLKKDERYELSEFQNFSAYLTNSLIFLLMGITTANILGGYQPDTELFILVSAAIIAVFVSRAFLVYTISNAINLFKGRSYIPLNYQHALLWGGLRGAVALALALSIGDDMPFRDEIVIMAVAVVIFTIIIDGITTKPFTKQLGLDRPSNLAVYEYYTGIIQAKVSALRVLEKLKDQGRVEPQIATRIRNDYSNQIAEAESEIRKLYQKILPDHNALKKHLWIRLIMVEGSIYEDIYENGYISEIVLDEMRFFINLRLDDVSSGKIPPREYDRFDSFEYRLSIKAANFLSGLFKGHSYAKNLRKFALTTRYQKYIAMNSASIKMDNYVDVITSGFDFPEEITEEAGSEYRGTARRSKMKIDEMAANYPELSEDIDNYYTRLSMLIHEEDYYFGMKKRGFIFPNVHEELLENINTERKRLEEHIYNII